MGDSVLEKVSDRLHQDPQCVTQRRARAWKYCNLEPLTAVAQQDNRDYLSHLTKVVLLVGGCAIW